jgi:hypothetical protein
MSNVGQRERATQNRIVRFFQDELKYRSIKTVTMPQWPTGKIRLIKPFERVTHE